MSAPDAPPAGGLSDVLRRNIREMAAMKSHFEQESSGLTRLADRVTGIVSTPYFVVVHVFVFAAWFIMNTALVPGVKPFDPFPFVMLAMAASVESILLSSFVLISQDRMSRLSFKRDNLDLQISLLTEHEVTRLIAMVETLVKHTRAPMPTDNAELAELKADVEPRAVVEAIDKEEASGQPPLTPGPR